MLKFNKSIMVLSVAMVGVTSISDAQKLAVPGKTPANPTMIISIPDAGAMWTSIEGSPLGGPLGQLFNFSEGHFDDDAKQTLEKELGFSIDTPSLMKDTISGVDLYFIENSNFPGFVVNVAFKNRDHAHKVLEQVKREAAGASGSSGGVSADTVTDSMMGTARTLFLPAFEIYLAADGNVVTYSNIRPAISSSHQDEGRAIFTSDFFTRSMSHLASEKHHMWSFGEPSGMAPLWSNLLPENNQTAVQVTGKVPSSTVYIFESNFMKFSSFTHQDDMPMAQRRYSMTAPVAGDVSVLNFFSQDAIAAVGTNHFDGLAILEIFISQLENTAGGSGGAAMFDEALKGSRATLGFDVRNDLLSNLGPDMGLAVSKPAAGAGPLPVDVVLVSKIKDTTSFANVIDVMKKTFGDMEKAATGGDNTTAPTTPGKMEDYKGAEINTYTLPTGIQGNVAMSFCVTRDGYFLFAMNDSSIKKAIDLAGGASGSMMQSERFKSAKAQLDPNQNTILLVDMSTVMAELEPMIGQVMLQQKIQVDDKKDQAVFDILTKVMKGATVGMAYRNNGVKQQVHIQM